MKNLALKFIVLYISFYSPNIHASTSTEDEEYYTSGLNVVLSFTPSKKKCLQHKYNFSGNTHKYYFYRDLKEFIINKNGKYCMWGSNSWDYECQEVSLQYAYSDYGRSKKDPTEFKQVVINFIKNIQDNNFDKAIQQTDKDSMFFTDDYRICLSKNITMSNLPGCRSYFNKLHKNKSDYGDFNMKILREHLMKIDTDNLKFYLADLSKRQVYTIVIPYEYQNVQKEFSITFNFYPDSAGNTHYYKSIYAISIYDPIKIQ